MKLAKKVFESNLGTLRMPFKMTYVVTKSCGSRCLNCNIWQSTPKSELKLEEIERFARNSPFLSWIDFTGGEPTDRADFVEVVSAFMRNSPELVFVRIPTNGMNPERAHDVFSRIGSLKPPVFVASVSIDGPPVINDRIRGIPGGFDEALETYRRLKSLRGLHTYVSMTLYPENVHTIDETVESIRAQIPGFRHRDLHVNLPQISSHYYENQSPKQETAVDFSDSVKSLLQRRGMPHSAFDLIEKLYLRKSLDYFKTRRTPVDCSALLSSFFLSETGEVYPCSIWDRPLGNIRDSEYSLESLIHTPGARELRRQVLRKECSNCWTPCDAFPSLATNLFNPSAFRKP